MAEETAAVSLGRRWALGLRLLRASVVDGYGVIYDKRAAVTLDIVGLAAGILR